MKAAGINRKRASGGGIPNSGRDEGIPLWKVQSEIEKGEHE
jgi:hypothetical protein